MKDIEGEVITVGEDDKVSATTQQRLDNLQTMPPKARPYNKLERRINVTKIINEHGFNPVVTLIHIATNNYQALGLAKPVTAHEMNSAAQTILSYTAPGLKPVEVVDPEADVPKIPVYTGRRELPESHAPVPTLDDKSVEDE